MSRSKILIGAIIVLVGIVFWLTVPRLRDFQRTHPMSELFAPGQLSHAHKFLQNQCTSCHIPNQGVSSLGCITCHANNQNLLQRRSSAFHSSIKSCKECHQEHRGGSKPPLSMDHLALAKLGAKAQENISSKTPLISALSCVNCHATRDKHQGQFGTSCLNCHTTFSWSIAQYRHPSPNSRDCAQCHLPPPSHNMMHFKMISMKVAGKETAKVNQCFLCHQTTSWNDIKGVGWYKHH
ncbi:MAG: hypothetical protein K2X47_09900 [Bdellovibrionales bacterium]|nr:hypothetical protein [Bdellovibrionales bacterium]